MTNLRIYIHIVYHFQSHINPFPADFALPLQQLPKRIFYAPAPVALDRRVSFRRALAGLCRRQAMRLCRPSRRKLLNKDVCISAHVYDVVQLPNGTSFLDVCTPQTSDDLCRFTIVSLWEDPAKWANSASTKTWTCESAVSPTHARPRGHVPQQRAPIQWRPPNSSPTRS